MQEVREEDIGTRCGLFEVRKISDEYFAFLEECKDPKACSILLRGASKDVLNEIERNLLDAMSVVRNIVMDPRIVPGGGATEMAIATVRAHTTTPHEAHSGLLCDSFAAFVQFSLSRASFLMKTIHARRMNAFVAMYRNELALTIHSSGT